MPVLRFPPLGADLIRAAESAFGRDHPYVKIGDQLDTLLDDLELPASVTNHVVLANTFWPFSLASILQYWEDLTDQQMANATRTRLDFKYALHLSLDFPGVEPSSLCTFRRYMLADQAGKETFQEMINRLKEFASNQKKRETDVECVIGAICLLSRAEIMMEAMSIALEAIATACPSWLVSNALPHWYKRYYGRPCLQQIPHGSGEIQALIQTIGKDGQHLLATIGKTKPLDCSHLPEIQTLRRVIADQFEQVGEELRWRSGGCASCHSALQI